MVYRELAEQFFLKSIQMKKVNHQQILDESLRGELFTLLYLRNREAFVLPGEISEEMDISTARVATILNNLEDKAFIERQIDPLDRRRILVTLTPSGKAYAERHNEKVINKIAKTLEILGEHDAKEFLRITSKMIDLASEREGGQ